MPEQNADFECDSDDEYGADEEEETEERNRNFHEKWNIIIDMCRLRAAIQANLTKDVAEENMTQTAKEVYDMNRQNCQGEIESAGVSNGLLVET